MKKRFTRRRTADSSATSPATGHEDVWPPVIQHSQEYQFEPELLKPVPRQVESPERTKAERAGASWAVVVGVLIVLGVTYLMPWPKNRGIHSFSDLITLPQWHEIPQVLPFIAMFPVGCLIVGLLSTRLARRAVATGMPLVAYVFKKNGGIKPSITYRFQMPTGKWIYADYSASDEEYAAAFVGQPFTVITAPGVHPFVYVCVYHRCGLLAGRHQTTVPDHDSRPSETI